MLTIDQIQTNFDFSTLEIYFLSFLNLLVLLALISGFFLVVYVLVKYLLLIQSLKKPYAILEVTPPHLSEQSPYTTEQFFNLIHALSKHKSWLERFFNIYKNYSFEIVSTKSDGIRYLIRVPEEDGDLVQKTLLSYLPDLKIKVTTDYLITGQKQSIKYTELKLANNTLLPLQKQDTLNKHDPIAYITGSMTKLDQSELIAFQIIATAVPKSDVPNYNRFSKLIYTQKDLVKGIRTNGFDDFIESSKVIFWLFIRILLLPLGLLIFLFSDGKDGPWLKISKFDNNAKSNNPYQNELEIMIKSKLDQPLFRVSMRLLIRSKSADRAFKIERGFISSLSSYSNSSYQAILKYKYLNHKAFFKYRSKLFAYRAINPLKKIIFSTSELSDLYHFPFTKTTKTEDIVKAHSKELPAPVSLKKADNLDIVFANNLFGGTITPIGLTADERRRHMYILGATGTGKSTLLLSMINQDIQNNKGLCVIDPHGDLIEQVLHCIPENRIKDVIYFNPDDVGYPMGINLLELSQGLDGDDALREKEFITESIISLFHKIYTDKYSGPRMEYILRNTIHTAFLVPGATLFTVYKLLINTPFRKSVVANVTDENLRDFWKYEFAKAGDFQKVKMISPITNKIGRFLFSPIAKRILEQEKSTINFDLLMDDGKILLCNLSKGRIGEDNSEVFGIVVLTKIQLAALKRARVEADRRRDFYLYVDEFQNFVTPAFAQILSEARKYKLNAILAHQTTSQLEDKSLVNVTLANTGTVICFRTANPDDETMILPQFRPYIEKGEIASLPAYHFYMRIGALNPEEPMSGVTVPVMIKDDPNSMHKIIKSSRDLYTKKWSKTPNQPIRLNEKANKNKTLPENAENSVLP